MGQVLLLERTVLEIAHDRIKLGHRVTYWSITNHTSHSSDNERDCYHGDESGGDGISTGIAYAGYQHTVDHRTGGGSRHVGA